MTQQHESTRTPSTPSRDGPLNAVGVDVFYRDYWQQRPLLLRNALPGIRSPLDADELAGLACEEFATSRIITGCWEANNFQVEHGPIAEERFDAIGDRDWTLLVQDVDKLLPEAAQLLSRFDFLPAWRVDDLMVSFAAPGGSVGPHTDAYDVFLVQLEGRRRWQIAEHFDATPRDGLELKVLNQFTAEQEWICEPGDILYLPPNVAHYGVALDPCLTASVGLRAPSLADLLDDLANTWAEHDNPPRYRDAHIQPPTDRWQVDQASVDRFRTLLRHVADAPDDDFKAWLGAALGRYRLATQLLDEPLPDTATQQPTRLSDLLQRQPRLHRQPAARLHWIPLQQDAQQTALLCANGDVLKTTPAIARHICRSETLDTAQYNDPELISFLLNSHAFQLHQ